VLAQFGGRLKEALYQREKDSIVYGVFWTSPTFLAVQEMAHHGCALLLMKDDMIHSLMPITL
jgi:hypothetical protein